MKVTIKQRLTLGLIMFLLPVWAYAQMVNIKGTVKDNKGETLMGVSILEVGSTSNGTITDLDGKFSITMYENCITAVFVHRLRKTNN